jgi:hypothetical protein
MKQDPKSRMGVWKSAFFERTETANGTTVEDLQVQPGEHDAVRMRSGAPLWMKKGIYQSVRLCLVSLAH